jgi:uncharacterized phage protein (TIGR02218 family)
MSLAEHLATGTTTVARAWAVNRRDGRVLGFTDHDRDLQFDGVLFRARSGMSARSLQQGTGLAVDNSEAVGALSDEAISEADVLAGRYDGAEVRIWWVNWADPSERELRFRGTLGEITRNGGAFQAELRGLTEPLGRSQGRIYQAGCTAQLGDGACRFDLATPGYSVESVITDVLAGDRLVFGGLAGLAPRWFEKGRLIVLGGIAAGLEGLVKADRTGANGREILLWQELGLVPSVGDSVRLLAGCDRRPETCRTKFGNFMNFRGFPHIPGEDWMMAVPREGDANDGSSLRR